MDRRPGALTLSEDDRRTLADFRDLEAELLGGQLVAAVVVAALTAGVVDAPDMGKTVGGLVEQGGEHGLRSPDQALAGDQDLGELRIPSDPAQRGEVAPSRLGCPATVRAGRHNDDGRGNVRVPADDRCPRGFEGGDERGLAPETVKAIYLTLAQVMRTAWIDRLIGRSPCIGVELPKQGSGEEMRFLTAREVSRLAEAITPRFRVLIYTAAYTGMRAGELVALKRRRVDVTAGRIDVVEAMAEVKGVLVTGATKTGKRRTLTIPGFLVGMLQEHFDAYPSPA